MAQGTLQINTEKLLPIIKKWLYSDKEIFLRELVSNSCDALSKLKMLRDDQKVSYEESELAIDIQLDKEKKTLTISDTGIGMTSSEVEKYIAQLAFSGAEEFLDQYQNQNESDQVIGHFGLGFYSAYMVSKLVEIDTLSYQEGAQAAYWSCDGSTQYTIDEGTRGSRGTKITLHIDDEEFLDLARIRTLLIRYCSFLPYPIHLNGERINEKNPLWLKSPSECTDQEYLEFYRQLHPLEPEPMFWVHLNVDYPFHLKGILYFPKIDGRFDFQKSHLKLYCNRVFVSDNCSDLMPEYLTVLRGCIDSPDIPLNVSRSYLQTDKTVRSLANHISKKVADRLKALYTNEPESFKEKWEHIETIIKLGIIHDEKFYDRIKECLIWKTTAGEWTTLDAHKENHPEKLYYTQDENSPFLDLYKKQGIDVLIAKGPIDTPLMNFLETKLTPAKFQRVDGGIDSALVDADREKTLLDADGKTEGTKIATFVKQTLGIDQLEVDAKSLANDEVPGVLIFDEQTRRMREALRLSGQDIAGTLPNKKTFIVNTNNPLIQSLHNETDPQLAKEILTHLYQLAQLSQKELSPEDLPSFIQRSTKVLSDLLSTKK